MTSLDALWEYPDPVGSEARFRAHLESLPPAERGETLTQLARALCLQRRHADALAALDEAEALGGAMVAPRAPLERGRVFTEQGRVDEALAQFARALEASKAAGDDRLTADALHMIGYVDPDPERAVAALREGVALAESSADEGARRWRGTLHAHLGGRAEDAGDFAAALDWFERCHAFRLEAKDTDRARGTLSSVARQHRKLGDPARAEALLQDALAEAPDNGYVCEELAETLLAQGRAEAARPLFATAYDVLAADPWFPPTEPERLERLRRLGGR